MIVTSQDLQVVGEVLSTLFTIVNDGTSAFTAILQNTGQNTINYQWQELVGGTWSNIGTPGSVYNTTLQSSDVAVMTVSSAQPNVRLIGNASGGAFLSFSIQRNIDRPNGGYIK